MSVDPQHLLRELFATAIDAAHPRQVLEPYLPADRSGRVIVIGAGKAAAAMALVVEDCWQGEVSGLARLDNADQLTVAAEYIDRAAAALDEMRDLFALAE